jgi:hypothetical protein
MAANLSDIKENERLVSICNEELCLNPEHNVVIPSNVKTNDWGDDLCKALEAVLFRESKVTETGCREWIGGMQDGYGRVGFSGTRDYVHRMAMRVKMKSYFLPTDKEVAHKCNNQICFNASHLELKTKAENAFDKIEAGTNDHGEKSTFATITNEQARKIKFSKGNGSRAERAKEFNVSRSLIASIDQGKSWNFLGPIEEKDNYSNKGIHAKIKKEKRKNHVLLPDDFKKGLDAIQKRVTEIQYEQSTLCWIWKLTPTEEGYGRFEFKAKNYMSHVLSWLCSNEKKEVEKGYVIRHKCRQRLCCNPNHLEKGTYAQNAQDRYRDGTMLRGENNPMSKISDKLRAEITESFEDTKTCKERAEFFGVPQTTVESIDKVSRKRKREEAKKQGLEEPKSKRLPKLNKETARAIKFGVKTGTPIERAKKYGVARLTLLYIESGQNWAGLAEKEENDNLEIIQQKWIVKIIA